MFPGRFSKKAGLYKMNRMFMDGGGKSDPYAKDVTFRSLGVSDSSRYAGKHPVEMDASVYNALHGRTSIAPPGVEFDPNHFLNAASAQGADGETTGERTSKVAVGDDYRSFLQKYAPANAQALQRATVDPRTKLDSDFYGASYDEFNGSQGTKYEPGSKVYALRDNNPAPQGNSFKTPAGMLAGTYQYQDAPYYKPPVRNGIASRRKGGNVGFNMGWGDGRSLWNVPLPFASGGQLPFYAKGGKIKIKPSHAGRFTAFKKRTGETTAEAKHSSSPAVRKMATFAANAAKWHHKKGGKMSKYSKPC